MSLTDFQIDEVRREYDKKLLQDKHQQNERIREINQNLPRIAEINSEIASLSTGVASDLLKRGISDPDKRKQAMEEYHKKIDALRKEKTSLLTSNGYAADYLDMHYTCPDCKDTGYIDNKKCHCYKKAEINMLYNQSNLGNILDKENFKTFNLAYYSKIEDPVEKTSPYERIKDILKVCKTYMDEFDKPDKTYSNLIFFGKPGVGKTFLTHCIAKDILEKNHSVIYLSSIRFFKILSHASFDKNYDNTGNRQLKEINNCDLLIIDDLGTELTNSFTISALFEQVNERILNNRSTIISTNMGFKELITTYTERVTSRFDQYYTYLNVIGDDIRQKI